MPDFIPPTTINDTWPFLYNMPEAIDGREVMLVRGDDSDVFNGAFDIDTDDALPNSNRTFSFFCKNRREIKRFTDFFNARRGKHEAFFFPTWRWEFDLRGYEEPNAGTFVLHLSHSRLKQLRQKHPIFGWFMIQRGLAWHFLRSTGAGSITENIYPGVDRVYTGTLGESVPGVPDFAGFSGPVRAREDYRVHWLRYGRFDSDILEWEYIADDAATTNMQIVQCPNEVPFLIDG